MSTSIHQPASLIPNVVPNFGWYYGISPTRMPEDTYQEDQTVYPPGMTSVGGGSSITLPLANIPTSFGTLVQLQTAFEISGTIEIDTFTAGRTTVQYTGLDIVGGFPSFIGCTGGTGLYAVGTAIYDPRFYVDQMPLNARITFDTIDHQNLGLPVTIVPDGVTIISYRWDFGNGFLGYGPFASTTYIYSAPPPSIQGTLTITDSLGRTTSCAQRLNLRTATTIWGASLRERQSNAGYR